MRSRCRRITGRRRGSRVFSDIKGSRTIENLGKNEPSEADSFQSIDDHSDLEGVPYD